MESGQSPWIEYMFLIAFTSSELMWLQMTLNGPSFQMQQ